MNKKPEPHSSANKSNGLPQKLHSFWEEHDQTLSADQDNAKVELTHDLYRGMPKWFNGYLAHFQTRAVKRFTKKMQTGVAPQILDIGCGTGRWSGYFQQKDFRTVAIDIGYNALKIASVQHPQGQYVNCILPDIPIANGAFEAAISVTVLQLIPYELQIQAVQNIYRTLKAGGYVILCEATDTDDPSKYIFANSFQDWVKLFEQNGFDPIDQTGCEYISHVKWFHRIRSLISRPGVTSSLNVTNVSAFLTQRPLIAILIRIVLWFTYPFELLATLFLPAQNARLACLLFKKR